MTEEERKLLFKSSLEALILETCNVVYGTLSKLFEEIAKFDLSLPDTLLAISQTLKLVVEKRREDNEKED